MSIESSIYSIYIFQTSGMTLFSYGSHVDPLMLTSLLSAFDMFGNSLFGRITKSINYGDKHIIIARNGNYAAAVVADKTNQKLELLTQTIINRFLSKYLMKLSLWDGFEGKFNDFKYELRSLLEYPEQIEEYQNKNFIYPLNVLNLLKENFANVIYAFLIGEPIIITGTKEKVSQMIYEIAALFDDQINIVEWIESQLISELIIGQKARVIIGSSYYLSEKDDALIINKNGELNKKVENLFLIETANLMVNCNEFNKAKELLMNRIKFLFYMREYLNNEKMLGEKAIEIAVMNTGLSKEIVELINKLMIDDEIG